MSKRKPTGPLIVASMTAAGLAVGAGIALGAHPVPIQLKTFEEVAAQYGAPVMPVMVDPVTKKGFPYSPKQTCGGCHDYNSISDHAFHSAQGRSEWVDTANGAFDAAKAKPWTQGTAMYGKW